MSEEMENYVHLYEKQEDRKFRDVDFPSPSDCAKVMSRLAEDLVHSISRKRL